MQNIKCAGKLTLHTTKTKLFIQNHNKHMLFLFKFIKCKKTTKKRIVIGLCLSGPMVLPEILSSDSQTSGEAIQIYSQTNTYYYQIYQKVYLLACIDCISVAWWWQLHDNVWHLIEIFLFFLFKNVSFSFHFTTGHYFVRVCHKIPIKYTDIYGCNDIRG